MTLKIIKAKGVEPAQPDRTSERMMKEGIHFCTIAGPRSFTIETWVQEVAAHSGEEMDWRMIGGRACILYIGDRDKVIASTKILLPRLTELYLECKHNWSTTPKPEDVIVHFPES